MIRDDATETLRSQNPLPTRGVPELLTASEREQVLKEIISSPRSTPSERRSPRRLRPKHAALVTVIATAAVVAAPGLAVADRVAGVLNLIRDAPPTGSVRECTDVWNSDANRANRQRIADERFEHVSVSRTVYPPPLVPAEAPRAKSSTGCSYLFHDGRRYIGFDAVWDEDERTFGWFDQAGMWAEIPEGGGEPRTVTPDGRIVADAQ